MEIQFRQTSIGWCAPITLANVFKNDAFLEYKNQERFKGCQVKEVHEMLNDVNKGWLTVTLAEISIDFGCLPIEMVWNILTDKTHGESFIPFKDEYPVLPFFLSVRKTQDFHHFVAVLRAGDNIYYLDPYFPNLIKINSVDELQSYFIDCVMIERLVIKGDDDQKRYAFLYGDKLGYQELFNGS